MTPAPGPRTEAGAQLLNEYTTLSLPRALNYILAIESEARAGLDVERLRDAINNAPIWDMDDFALEAPLSIEQAEAIAAAYGGRDDGLRAALERIRDTDCPNGPWWRCVQWMRDEARAALARGEEEA